MYEQSVILLKCPLSRMCVCDSTATIGLCPAVLNISVQCALLMGMGTCHFQLLQQISSSFSPSLLLLSTVPFCKFVLVILAASEPLMCACDTIQEATSEMSVNQVLVLLAQTIAYIYGTHHDSIHTQHVKTCCMLRKCLLISCLCTSAIKVLLKPHSVTDD